MMDYENPVWSSHKIGYGHVLYVQNRPYDHGLPNWTKDGNSRITVSKRPIGAPVFFFACIIYFNKNPNPNRRIIFFSKFQKNLNWPNNQPKKTINSW